MKSIALFVLLLLAAGLGALEVPFHRGVNLTGWYQEDDVGQTPVGRFGPVDFGRLKDLGVDGVRLPVNFAAFVGPAPGFVLRPLGLDLLDRGVDGLLAAGFTVVLDNHSDPTDPRLKGRLEAFERALWTQLSRHYRSRGPKLIYEFQNEPHDLAPEEWHRIQRRLVADLRQTEPDRLAVVTGADWGGVSGLLALPALDDPNLIYSFHFYDPFVFTHQGADWTDLVDLKGVRFPPRGPVPEAKGPKVQGWWKDELAKYYQSHAAVELARTLDQVTAFAAARKVPVWCGEFGAYDRYADPDDRARWYQTVRGLLDDRSIPWTMWDYRGGFGLFRPGSAEDFDQDLNAPVVRALGFTMPPQRAPGPRKVTAGFALYRDQGDDEVPDRMWLPPGSVDFFDQTAPGEGRYSLRLAQLPPYGSVSWSFAPVRDLTALRTGASVTFLVRANQPKFAFVVRLIDAPSGGDGLPWRLDRAVTDADAPGDGRWHRLTLPLDQFGDAGAWVDGAWHDPRPGAFDWTRVGGVQLVAEQGAFGPLVLGIDDLGVVRSGP